MCVIMLFFVSLTFGSFRFLAKFFILSQKNILGSSENALARALLCPLPLCSALEYAHYNRFVIYLIFCVHCVRLAK